MSTEIEFNRIAFKTKIETDYGKNNYYMALGLYGSNNLLDMDGNIVKEWTFLGFGRKGTVISRIIDLSKDTEGNMLRYQNGDTKPENFIKNWRKTLKEAKDFEYFRNLFRVIAYYKLDSIDQEQIDFLKNNNWVKDTIRLHKEYNVMKKPLEEPKDLIEIKEAYGYEGKMDGEPHFKVIR